MKKPDDFVLASAVIVCESVDRRHVRKPFTREPDFGATCVNDELALLLALAEKAV